MKFLKDKAEYKLYHEKIPFSLCLFNPISLTETKTDKPFRWVKNIGSSLIKSVNIVIGGHQEKRWYCTHCNHCFYQKNPYHKTNQIKKVLSFFPSDIEKQIINISTICGKTIWTEDEETEDEENTKEITCIATICISNEFIYESRKGVEIDKIDSSFSPLWI